MEQKTHEKHRNHLFTIRRMDRVCPGPFRSRMVRLFLAVRKRRSSHFRQPANPGIAATATLEPTSTPTSIPEPTHTTAAYPMVIDPALCAAIDPGRTCPEMISPSTGARSPLGVSFGLADLRQLDRELCTAGTQPIERLALFATWIYPKPDANWISDYYGFEPRIQQIVNRSPVSDGVTTSSTASGVISIAQPGEVLPEGLFVLPDMTAPAGALRHPPGHQPGRLERGRKLPPGSGP